MSEHNKVTGWEIECACGGWTPLKVNRNGRFYFDHHKCNGGTYAARLPQDIDVISDIEAMRLHKVRKIEAVTKEKAVPLRNETKHETAQGEAVTKEEAANNVRIEQENRSERNEGSERNEENPFLPSW